MNGSADHASGKGHTDENFPVASVLIAPAHRAPILAFYRFARLADDIADHASAAPEEKLAQLEVMRATVSGESDADPAALALREAMGERGLEPVHALDLLEAFRRDVTKLRTGDWDDLIDYCRYSAMPVGRFMLDVHGEDRSTWAASDAICAALQINNHLQDCGKDYRDLNRVYIPRDALAASGATVELLGEAKSTPQRLKCLQGLARRTETLLHEGRSLPGEIKDTRFALEVCVIDAFADRIVNLLKVRDPLSENVHLSKGQMAGIALSAMAGGLFRRMTGGTPRPARTGRVI